MAGFALEVGDRLSINGEKVVFKGWVDQSQTAIEVRAIADDGSSVKQIRAKEIKSIRRSPDTEGNGFSERKPEDQKSDDTTASDPSQADVKPATKSVSSDSKTSNSVNQTSGDRANSEATSPSHPDNLDNLEEISQPEAPEIPKEPEYNAWEVWTYLERQRVNTLKLINTFHAEWEANRFVREAERSAPANLRVHYEIRPVLLDEAELNGGYQQPADSYKSQNSQPDRDEEDYTDAIDVEVIL